MKALGTERTQISRELEKWLALTSFACLATAGVSISLAMGWLWLIAAVGGGLFGAWYISVIRRRYLPGWFNNIFLLAAFSMAAYFAVVRYRDLALVFSCFLLAALLFRLFQERRLRDYGLNLAGCFIIVVFASLFVTGILLAFILLCFLFLAMAGLVLMQLASLPRGSFGPAYSRFHPRHSTLPRSFARASLPAMGFVVLVAVIGFVLIPRSGIRLRRVPPFLSPVQYISGFNPDVRLGEVGSILENSQPVLRVTLSSRGTPYRVREDDLLMRGVTFSHFDGRAWHKLPPGFQSRPYRARSIFRKPSSGGDLIVQQIIREPILQNSLFALYRPVWVEEAERNWIIVDPLDWTFGLDFPRRRRLSYTVYSALPPANETLLRQAKGEVPEPIKKLYLDDSGISSDLKGLAFKVAGESRFSKPFDKVVAIRDYLLKNYSYTVEVPSPRDREPVDSFLFVKKRGHCEYFATSMVLMLRAVGVPARLVSGFKGGEWNHLGRYYLIRQSNAHTWVEAYLGGVGWVPFDPTPARAARRYHGTSGTNPLAQVWDFLGHIWYINVIGFDRDIQQGLYLRIRTKATAIAQDIWSAISAARGLARAASDSLVSIGFPAWVLVAIFIGVMALAFWAISRLLGRLWRFLRPSRREAGPPGPAVGFYKELLSILDRYGFRKRPSCTPRSFAEQLVALEGENLSLVRHLTEEFYLVRFGGRELASAEARRLSAAVKEVGRILYALRGKPRRRFFT